MAECCLPVVDFADYALGVDPSSLTGERLQRLAEGVGVALQEAGCMYLKNTGLSQEQVTSVNRTVGEFFNLPENVKAKYQRLSHNLNGWLGCGGERLNKDEPFDYKEYIHVEPTSCTNWPDEVSSFRIDTEEFYSACADLAKRVLRVIAIAIGIPDEDYFVNCHNFGSTTNTTLLRFNHYPAVDPANVIPGQLRCGVHTDYHTITLLFQDDAGGLEVMLPDGRFVAAAPLADTVFINVADLLQRWSGDRLPSAVHRVIMPKADRTEHARRSIAFFVVPDMGTMVKPLDGSDKYPAIEGHEFVQKRVRGNEYKYV